MDYTKPTDNEQCKLCGRWNNRPVGVDTIVYKDKKILLIKRATDPDKGKYAVPGGYLDREESAEVAAKREVKEETGLDVEIVKLIGVRSNPDRYRQIVEIGFVAKVLGGTEHPGDGVESIIWADPYKLPSDMATTSEHGEIVQSALKILEELDI